MAKLPDEAYNRQQLPSQLPAYSEAPVLQPVHFLTFGGGGAEFRRQVQRIAVEAGSLGCFHSIHALSDDVDHPWIQELLSEHGEFIRKHKKGYGLWIWKPFLVAKALRGMHDGELLVYMDSGCELSSKGMRIFNEYLHRADDKEAMLWEIPFLEKDWTSSYVIEELKVPQHHLTTRQIQATWFVLKRSARTLTLVDEWMSLSLHNGCEYLIGAPKSEPISENSFIQNHRQDQSMFSIVCKKFGMPVSPWEDRFVPWLYVPGSQVFSFPVHARRCKGKGSVYKVSSQNACLPGIWSKHEVRLRIAFSRMLHTIITVIRKFALAVRG